MSEAHDDVDWEFQEENLAGAYLTQALTAFFGCADARALYPKRSRKDLEAQDRRDVLIDMMLAASKRLELARTSILFSALAAEAYVNEFLWREGKHAGLAEKDIEAIDRLPTAEKFVLSPRLILGKAVFGRGRQPIQDIRALFKLRDNLVHPKVRRVKVRKHHLFDRPGFEDYNPESAARFVLAVGAAAVALADATDPPGPTDGTARALSEKGEPLLELGREAREHLPPRPAPRVRAIRVTPTLPPQFGIPATATGPLPPSRSE